MVRVTFFQNDRGQITGFDTAGHAEYADENDIVCAATSALVLNCINSIESLTGDRFESDSDQERGGISCRIESGAGDDSQILLKSLALGLESIKESYGKHIEVIFEEVSET